MTQKTALLTGGSRGIGAATQDLLEANGWKVAAPGRERLNMFDPDSVMAFEQEWLANGCPKFDSLILCHGEWYSQEPRLRDMRVWYHHLTLRVVWPIMFTEFFLRSQDAGRPENVLMVSSTRGFIGGVNTGPYSVACAAQIALMQGYAREWGDGVRFNVVCPGWTDTDMGKQVAATGGASAGAVPQDPKVVARVIVELVTGDANGKVMRVVNGEASEARWAW